MFDFGFGYSEMFVVAVVAIIVIGPKDLPKVLRALGRTVAKMRGMAREFQGHLDQAMKDRIEVGVLRHQLLAQAQRVALHRQRAQRARRFQHDRAAGRLVDAARLHADEAVLADVDAADAVGPAGLV